MSTARIVSVLLCAAVAAGAGTLRAAGPDEHVDRWTAEVAAKGIGAGQVVYPFAVSSEMAAWAENLIRKSTASTPRERLDALQNGLFAWKEDGFVYDEDLTLTAEEAFELRRGNCMSFTVLFVGLARSVGTPMSLVSVRKAPVVDRAESLVVVNRHVVAGYREGNVLTLFDFNVTSESPVVRHEVVSDLTASAMYHANLGSGAIRSGDLGAAIEHLRLATRLAPDWAPGWVNLAVAWNRQGRADEALAACRRALEAEPDSSSAYANIAAIHAARGDVDAARAALQAAVRGTASPFTLIAMADIEIAEGNLGAARSHLRRARWWHEHTPEVYEAMARLAAVEGDDAREARYRARAERLRQP